MNSMEDEDRLDLAGTFVVDFEPGLYGPFETRRLAEDWVAEQMALHGRWDVTYSWRVVPVNSTEGAAKPIARAL